MKSPSPLRKNSYVNVPFPLNPSVIKEAVQAFFKFLNQPDSVKTHIDFTIAPNHRRGDIGFKHREPDEHIYNDSKDFFHFHPDIFEKYAPFLKEHPVVDEILCKKPAPFGIYPIKQLGIFSRPLSRSFQAFTHAFLTQNRCISCFGF